MNNGTLIDFSDVIGSLIGKGPAPDLVQLADRTSVGPGITTVLEREIDVLVASDGLSWEQAKLVDPELGLSQAKYDAIALPEAEEGNSSVVSEPGVTGLTDEGTLFGQPVEVPTKRRAAKAGTKGKK